MTRTLQKLTKGVTYQIEANELDLMIVMSHGSKIFPAEDLVKRGEMGSYLQYLCYNMGRVSITFNVVAQSLT